LERFFIFTVDVERVPLENGGFDCSSIIDGIPLLLDLFNEFDVCSTFFLTSDVAENTADTIKEVIKHGHEIACHGFEHQLLDLSSRDEQLKNIKKATEIIDENLHVSPIGFRAPVNKVNEKTLEVLAELGYKYDSSVAPSSKILKKYYFPRAPRTPYWPSMNDIGQRGRSPILEIPLSVLPWIKLPIGLSYILLFGLDFYKFFLSRINQKIVTVFLHPYDLFMLPNQTKFHGIEQKRIFKLLYKKGKGKGYLMLRELLEFFEARFSPTYICAKEVLDRGLANERGGDLS
jgi:peptidoglycan/xylan/chitin deacetylase (PgdA/CDA1 family)